MMKIDSTCASKLMLEKALENQDFENRQKNSCASQQLRAAIKTLIAKIKDIE